MCLVRIKLLFGLLAASTVLPVHGDVAAASPYIPEGYKLERYEHLWKNSPFSTATAVPMEGNDTTWIMTAISILEEAPFVSFTNMHTRKSVSLSPGEASGGLKLLDAEWASDPGNSFAEVEINGTRKRLIFERKQLELLSNKGSIVVGKQHLPVPHPAIMGTQSAVSPNSANHIATPQNKLNPSTQIPRRRIIRRR